MPNFTPNSTIHIGHVPWDNSYRHTRKFASAAAQTTWMLSKCDSTLDKTNYTYVRMNNAIRVPFNAEKLYTYNYVMYQNVNYGTKWFYAFIVGVNYVNENTTELVLELDLMQTWMFDYTRTACFVEREHVNDDTVGLHINPEPQMPFETFVTSFVPQVVNTAIAGTGQTANAYIIVLLNVEITEYFSGGVFAGYVASPDSGGRYQGQYNACKAIIFPCTADGMTNFKVFITAVNAAGAAESICDVYTVPIWAIDNDHLVAYGGMFTGENVYTYSDASVPKKVDVNNGISVPSTNGSYTPHNNKLLTYPYTYLEVGDFSGRKTDYRYEFFTKDSLGKVHLMRSCAGISDGEVYITPMGYNGLTPDFDDIYTNSCQQPFTFSIANKISWVYAAYQNWLGQNGVSMALGVLTAAAFGIGGVAAITSTGGMAAINAAEPAALAGMSAIGGGVGKLGDVGQKLWRESRNPNKANGTTGTNSKLQNDYCGWYYAQITLRPEFAQIIDNFFDMFGYQVDLVKVPNETGRTSWNYVKCSNACNRGNVPADQMAAINNIYNAGITFWHVDDIGNYSLSNAIVTP